MSDRLSTVVADAQRRLELAGLPIETAHRDAVLLARHVLHWDASSWLARQSDPASQQFRARLDSLVARRTAFEPIAYIVGAREFFGRSFVVTPAVLIPRSETEFVVEEALSILSKQPDDALVVDVGAGSGCIGITIALEAPTHRVVLTDLFSDALDVARRNAEDLGCADRVSFCHVDLLSGFKDRSISVIVSNPPYVPESDARTLSREVVAYEPCMALFAGRDGLEVIRWLIQEARRTLLPGGSLVFEIGAGQADAVKRLVTASAGLSVERITNDLQQIPRVVVARRT